MTQEVYGLEDLSFRSTTQYKVVEEIGKGGMGIVYVADRTCMGVKDRVVLKTIRQITPAEIQDLLHEANIATQLRHVNIVKTHGLEALPYPSVPEVYRKRLIRAAGKNPDRYTGENDLLLFIAMDYVYGTDLQKLLVEHFKAGFLIPPKIGAFVVSRMCRALAYAHTHIIHRDISPDNIMIDLHGICKLTDFGVAIASGSNVEDIVGKSIYMSPEQYAGENVDERADQFSLGVVFYYVLTGVPPLWTDPRIDFDEQMKQIKGQLEKGIPSPHELRQDIPESISRIAMRMISFDPADRYSRIGMIGDEIEQNYLYAEGFGPTNESLAAYVRFFESGFTDCDTDDVLQISFLRDHSGRMDVRRPLRAEDYTATGQDMIQARQGSYVHWVLGKELTESLRIRAANVGKPIVMVRFGENFFETFLLEEGQSLTLGGSPDNECFLPDPEASEQHARIVRERTGATIEDLGSDSGTTVNGNAVTRAALENGDRIQIGRCRIYYLEERLPPEPEGHVELDGSPIDLAAIELKKTAFRFTSSTRTLAQICHIVRDIALGLQLEDGVVRIVSDAFERTIDFIGGIEGRRIEVRIFAVPSWMVMQIRDLENSDRIERMLGFLKGEALTGGSNKNSPLNLLIPKIDRIEYRHFNQALRLTKSLK